MKRFAKSMFPILMITIISVVTMRCTENSPASEPVPFTFTITTDQLPTPDLPDGAVLIVSANSATGEPLFVSEAMSLREDPRGFITEPVKVKSTDFILTECLIVSSDGDILYAIPAAQSPLAGKTTFALGEQVSVVNGNIGTLRLLSVLRRRPGDFGFHSFKHQTGFSILVTKAGTNRALAATAYILQGEDTIQQYALMPRVNKIAFSGIAGVTYTLRVVKETYAPYQQMFTTANVGRKTLRINLQPALTITAKGISDTSFPPLSFYIGGSSGTLTVDWGDGTVETKTLTPYETQFTHFYSVDGSYPLIITGDLDRVISFYSFYGDGVFSDIRFDHLVNLNELRYGLTACPSAIDLSQNRSLEFAMMPCLLNLETLALPIRHRLSYFDIDGANQLNTQDIDAIIDNLYANTVRENITGGIFSLALNWYQDETDSSMVGPPSAAALIKLDLLRDNYGWQIRPGNEPAPAQFFTERELMKHKAQRHERRSTNPVSF